MAPSRGSTLYAVHEPPKDAPPPPPPGQKILAIKFKFLGDVAIAVPVLRALKSHFPESTLHVLVADEARAIVEPLDWIDKVWALPRRRGQMQLRKTLPMLRALRAERFDRSVDFVGNDRGAILSLTAGARRRLGPVAPLGFAGRRYCYTERVDEPDPTRHWAVRDAAVLLPWGVPLPDFSKPLLKAAPALAGRAAEILPGHPVLFHLSTSQEKKEWPLQRWAELYRRTRATGTPVIFSSGPSPREQALLDGLCSLAPDAPRLPKTDTLALFMAVLARARAFVSPDTAPLHLAAGLGVPTVALFGPTSSHCWAPLVPNCHALQGGLCPCSGHWHRCPRADTCISAITVERVYATLERVLAEAPVPVPQKP